MRHAPATLDANAAAQEVQFLQEDVEVMLPTGYRRQIARGSQWRQVGTLPQGSVLRPVGAVFTIEGRQVHEAYLVVTQDKLVGFYLPGDRAYSALGLPVVLKLGERQ
ncbi:hypothetical protein C7R54_00865 [Achromobacter aloeverae]|uniref:Uncharacterized protein n=1 Tax=Achromobacter aloeverae TaxID=1750518 RepID=A0A4Q1HSF1_9BURK|nr:hypothetical protein C7R54_00865 [Achromobacter aloeverae]